ncbi:SagB/ThcOx family dehydrogenase [Nonomuraea sp. LPB2021202275-12-8]|uniref:SagB/ThcOx family dehydrogenase n=1 Tax=Nonomuraea sp. LPB2021202275-12-8 TaxID=3120159 RepID=UPI00300D27DB
MSTETVIRLRPDADLARLLEGGDAARVLGAVPSAALKEAVQSLADGDVPESELTVRLAAEDPAALMRLHLLLRRLDGIGWLEHAVRVDGREIARLRPVGRNPVSVPSRLDPGREVRLARDARVRVSGGRLVAETPRGHCVVELAADPPGPLLLGALADWVRPGDSPPGGAALPLLAAAGLLETRQQAAEPSLWSPHDLWTHARARGTRLSASYGATFHGADLGDPAPAVPAARTGLRITLEVPDLERIAAQDPPLTEVIEGRRSVRVHDDEHPITLAQLSELLYRTARQRRLLVGEHGQELSDRPYPNGGAIYEQELYPLVNNVDGLEPGLWHYHAGDHALEFVAAPGKPTARLTEVAREAALMTADPQVLLVVAARFGRVSWKYETIAYSLMLKHVGVLYQTIYLVATAMGLAVCGLGGGDADDFADATGLDYHTEGSVGELLLGSRSPEATS